MDPSASDGTLDFAYHRIVLPPGHDMYTFRPDCEIMFDLSILSSKSKDDRPTNAVGTPVQGFENNFWFMNGSDRAPVFAVYTNGDVVEMNYTARAIDSETEDVNFDDFYMYHVQGVIWMILLERTEKGVRRYITPEKQ